MQSPWSTFASPSSIRIAAAGQASTQVSHPVQSSGSITAVMLTHPEEPGEGWPDSRPTCAGPIRRSPPAPAPASAAKSSSPAAPVRDPAPSEAVNLRLLSLCLRGTCVCSSGRAALCLWLRRQDAPAHTPAGHRPHALGPGTIKSWHVCSPLLLHITHMREII